MTRAQANPNPAADPRDAQVLRRVRRRLRSIAMRLRLLLVTRALLLCLGVVVLGLLLIGMADYLLRLPGVLRLLLLAGLAIALGRLCFSRLLPAWRSQLSEPDVALLIEKHDPTTRGVLASAVDLDRNEGHRGDSDNPINNALRSAALHTAAHRLAQFRPSRVLRPSTLGGPGLRAAVPVAALVLVALLSPNMFRVGTQRVLMPWDDVRWPVRYAIEDITSDGPHAIDAPLAIRALIGNTESQLDDTTRALVNWRLLDESGDAVGDWSRTLLMPQRRRDVARDIPIYEQLIDARERAARVPDDQRFTLEYRITTRDDQSRTRSVTLVRPPELRSTRVELELPAYARPIIARDTVASGTIETDASDTSISPVLRGTRVAIEWRFSKPIAGSDTQPEWVREVARLGDLIDYTQDDQGLVRLELLATESMLIEPVIRDLAGIPVRSTITASLEVLDDLRPSVQIVEPQRNENLAPGAQIELGAELSDDLGLTRGAMMAQIARMPGGSEGAPPETESEPTALLREWINNEPRATISTTLDLSTLDLSPGDELRVWATAWDLRISDSDTEIGRGESALRVFRIIAPDELIEQVRRSLDPLRNNLRSLDERQGQVQQLVRDQSPRSAEEQRALSERLRANQNAVSQLEQTVERNRIDDGALQDTLTDAARLLEEAAQQSERADDQIRRGSEDAAQSSQRRVRDRLGELLSMLDQGQDAWMALRNVQQLRSDLESIRDETQQLAQRTAGQSLDELSPQDRGALERILDRQMQNAEDARQAINTLDERAEQLEENDPTQAEALRRAAREARAAQLEEKLREAGAQIARNQTGSANQNQEEVLEDLEQLLEELENTIQNRDNALRRELASIMDSIKQLIDAQEREIVRLDSAMQDDDLTGMDARIIALVRNTLSVRDEALGAFPETRTIAEHIGRAANAQNSAISALRANTPDAGSAQQSQRGALQHLRNALEEAQRLDEQAAQRQAQQARNELRQQYEQMLDTQTRIHDESLALGRDNLDRRQRAQARSVSQSQQELRDELLAMDEQHEGLAEAPVFNLAHRQLDRLMEQSRAGLTDRQIQQRTTDAQRQAMSVLASLVEVLQEQQQQQQEDFEDGSSGGGEGGGEGSGEEPIIPPVAELKLLRSMQQLVTDQTRAMSELGEPATDDIRSVAELQKQLFEQGAALIERMNPAPQPGTPSGDPDEQPAESSGTDQVRPNPEPITPVQEDEPRP